MVLRGSKTHPQQSDIYELEKALHNLRQYLRSLDNQESQIEHEISEILHEDLIEHTIQQKLAALKTSDEFAQSIKILLQRLEYLESVHKRTVVKIGETERELMIMVQQFVCGGLAGMTARTFVAPIDRVKILIQTALTTGRAKQNIFNTAKYEIANGGIKSMWKGNFTNCVRVFPYAALQFASYERYKNLMIDYTERNNRHFGFFERIISGAMAGATAATLTYPLDVMRIRQVVYSDIRGPFDAIRSIYAEGGLRQFGKGWTPTVMSLAPFIACNFATFDSLKAHFIPDGNTKDASTLLVLGLGAVAGLTAQTACYPMDTIRRSMQLKGKNYSSILDCAKQIYAKNGNISGFYKGIIPNAIKIVPNNGIRFLMYSKLTGHLGIPEKKIRPRRKD